MQENPPTSMAITCKIIRKSIHTFLKHYHTLTSIAATLALPFALSILISQAYVAHSSAILPVIYSRFHSLFDAVGFPHSSGFFTLISLKLSQTISTSLITFPFTLSFLLLAKASVISSLFKKKSTSFSFVSIYNSLLSTHLCNSFIIFSANASCISLLFLAFTLLESFQINSPTWVLFLSAIAAVFYSIVLANALVICNLALVSSAMDEQEKGGFMTILRACVMIKGKIATALAMAVPINIGLAAVESLFNFRIITSQNLQLFVHSYDRQVWFVVLEGILIAFLYSILLVLDVIMSCFFYQSCKDNGKSHYKTSDEEYYYYDHVEKLKNLEQNA